MFSPIGIPRGNYFPQNPGLLWLHIVCDSLIALVCSLVSCMLLRTNYTCSRLTLFCAAPTEKSAAI